jgi:hypothetical protein
MRNRRFSAAAKPAPDAPLEVAKPSPLAAFVDMLHGMDANRAMLAGNQNDMWPGCITFLDDLRMMLHERMVVGIRTQWLRRVATPVWMAHRHLTEVFQHPDEKKRALEAIEILRQCQDIHVRETCIGWIQETHHV